jgi:4-amino-4-deoxy-L-arabinose transferase-like glycosyltransferase
VNTKNSLGPRMLQAILRSTRYRSWLIVLPVIVLAIALYVAEVPHNPPGYYIDESSVSYNAYTISQTGRDEFGIHWPLFFRAFGDYKNPVYIYLLAAIFRLTGPSITVARLLSAGLGLLTAFALGLLATRVTKQRGVGLLISVMALLTPWLFEMSRVVLEVALYPLVVTVFLLSVHRASIRERWSWRDAVWLAASLALVTYTYSIGRLLGPLLALGLLFFASRARRVGLALALSMYGLVLAPILIFQQRYPGALTGRFSLITYITPNSTHGEIVWEFIKHYFSNFNPWRLLVVGDPNSEQIAHIHGAELIFGTTAVLLVAGLWIVLRRHWREAWWRFVIYGLLVCVVPASLTKEHVHMLRLAPLPVFILVLTIPAIEWLWMERQRRRAGLTFLVLLILIQGAAFQWRFHANGHSPKRLRQFDNGYPEKIFARALAAPARPIYLADALSVPGYIQAYWYATLRRVQLSEFIHLAFDASPPVGALVISTEETCPRCRIIAISEFYTLYVADRPAPKREPLPSGAFRAGISVIGPPSLLHAGDSASLRVLVRNEGNSIWLARERSGGRYQVSLGNHWLDGNGQVLANDDGRTALFEDLRPQEERELKLTVNVPKMPGEYLLEIDMLQEEVSWFGLKGSQTVRLPMRVRRLHWW